MHSYSLAINSRNVEFFIMSQQKYKVPRNKSKEGYIRHLKLCEKTQRRLNNTRHSSQINL